MSAAVMMKRIAEASPRLKAKIAGFLYFFSLLTQGSPRYLFAAG
jgi:hypothetical protein